MAINVNNNVDGLLKQLGIPRTSLDSIGRAYEARAADRARMEQILFSLHAAGDLAGNTSVTNGNTQIPPQGYVPGPRDYALASGGNGIGNGFGGLNRTNVFGGGLVGRSLQHAYGTNMQFRQALEKQLGGVLVPHGGAGGRVAVWKPPFNETGRILRTAVQQQLMPKSPLVQAMGSAVLPTQGPGISNSPLGGVLRGLQAMEANITSFVAGQNKGGAGLTPEMEQLARSAGMDPSKASFEDRIFLALMSYGQAKEKEIAGKVSDLDRSMKNGAPTQDGVFGGLVSTAGGTTAKAIMGEIAGQGVPGRPALAGGIEAATMAAGLGGATGVTGQPGAPTGGATPGTGVGNPNDMSETLKQQMMTKMMDDLKKMYEMLSNIMKSMHDMQMGPIRNLRG